MKVPSPGVDFGSGSIRRIELVEYEPIREQLAELNASYRVSAPIKSGRVDTHS